MFTLDITDRIERDACAIGGKHIKSVLVIITCVSGVIRDKQPVFIRRTFNDELAIVCVSPLACLHHHFYSQIGQSSTGKVVQVFVSLNNHKITTLHDNNIKNKSTIVRNCSLCKNSDNRELVRSEFIIFNRDNSRIKQIFVSEHKMSNI